MITVQTTINATIEKVWSCWTKPEHITGWAFASDDWEAPFAQNEPWAGGTFKTRMQSKDGATGFDVEGMYDVVKMHERIEYTMSDGRQVHIIFKQTPRGINVIERFDAESEHTEEMQRAGWQAILDNFKKYVEHNP